MAEPIHLQQLLSHRVRAMNGRVIGRLEEVLAENDGDACYVTEYLLGTHALFHRLAVVRFTSAILGLLGVTRKEAGFRVRWDQLDLTNPSKPQLRCKVDELQPIDESRRRSRRKQSNSPK